MDRTPTAPILLLLLLAACGPSPDEGAEPGAPAAGPSAAGDEVAPDPPWSDWETTPSGLQYHVVEPGDVAEQPKTGDRVTVHYTGTFPNGTVFDSSRRKGEPFSFMLGTGQVIAGWDEAVAMMTPGARWKIRVPWQLAYGEKGRGQIGPRQDLLFDVELLQVRLGLDLADFPKRDRDAEVETESGLVYQVLEEGDPERGPAPGPGVALKIHYTLWNASGQFVMSSGTRGGQGAPNYLTGSIGTLQIGVEPEAFLQEIAALMRPGGVYRCLVPPELAWGDNAVHPRLPEGQPTVWRLELVDTAPIPPFRMPAPEKTVTTDSGLRYEILREGAGGPPLATDRVRVHYAGWLTDGTRFDSSYERFQPLVFPVDRVIPGWQEMLQLMRPGAVAICHIPAALAYGDRPPSGGPIPVDAPLVFRVELIEVVR